MNSLRYLVAHAFLGGMFFDAFISALINHHNVSVIIFGIAAIITMHKALKIYDRIKVK